MHEVYCPVCGELLDPKYISLVPDDCDSYCDRLSYVKYACKHCKGVKADDENDAYKLTWTIPKKYEKTITDTQFNYLLYLSSGGCQYVHTKEVADKLIKKYLAISETKRLQQEKRELFNMILEKYNVRFYYTENSQFIIEYEDSVLYINIDESKCLASNPVIFPKTSEFNTLKLEKMTEDFKDLKKDLQLLKEKYND